MRIIRIFNFFLLQFLEKYPKFKRPVDSIKNIVYILLGWLYWKYQAFNEHLRIARYNLSRRNINDPTSWLNFKNFPWLTLLAVIVCISVFFFDQYLNHLLPDIIPSVKLSLDGAKETVGLYLSAVNTIVGIIISLFTVGFQIASNYSERVKNYALGNISSKIISPFFFVVVSNFSIFILMNASNQLPRISFLLSTTLTIYSLYLVYFLIDKIIYGPQASYLFRKIFSEIKDGISVASSIDKYTYNSWSIVQNSRRLVVYLLRIQDDLRSDLTRLGTKKESFVYINAIAEELRFYSEKRKYIDAKRAWWFPQQYVQTKVEDPLMYPIKANYEIRGTGPLFTPKTNICWFEELVADRLEKVLSGLKNSFDPEEAATLINGLGLIFSGDYSKDEYERPKKTLLGAFENQEFDIFDKSWVIFCNLFNLVKNDDTLFIEYLNCLFATALVVIEGYELNNLEEHIKRLVSADDHLGMSKAELESLAIPTLARQVLTDYWERLEIEDSTEGKIITPIQWLKEEIILEYKKKVDLYVEKYISALVKHSSDILSELYKNKRYEDSAQILKLQLEWISRMIFLDKWENAEKLSDSIKNNIAYIVNLPAEVTVKAELREQIEKGLLPSLVKRNKKLYDFYLRAFLMVFIFIRSQEKEPENIIRLIRIPIAIGGLAYLVSELDQKPFFVTQLMKYLEGVIFVNGTTAEVLALAKDIQKNLDFGQNFRLIEDESNRYRGFYRLVINEVQGLPEDWGQVQDEFGYNKTVKHPSRFIRRVGAWDLYDMYECMDDFVEWVKFREEIKKLVQVLNLIQNDRLK